ncbi:MAG: carboxylating nicotinate-nucleotide diphosphorylase [Thermoplasmata archaeon]
METIKQFLVEDVGGGDLTSDLLLSNEEATACIVARENCVLAGLEEAKEVFRNLELGVESSVFDGKRITKNTEVLRIKGLARSILTGERLALNFLMRMSGIATATRELVELCRKVDPDVRIACTRKTTPGFRFYEKKAVIVGGGDAHRHGLFDSILIKDNHIKIVGSIEEAIIRAKKGSFTKKIEIEVGNTEDAMKAVRAGADIVMLDNMSPAAVEEAFNKIKNTNRNIMVEVSGGITPNNIMGYAPNANVISLGWITHSVRAINFNLDIADVKYPKKNIPKSY